MRALLLRRAVAAPHRPTVAAGRRFSSSLQLGNMPTDWAAGSILYLHDAAGLPWWATIALSSVMLRLAFVPLTLSNQRNAVNMVYAKPEVEALQRLNNDHPPRSPEEQQARVRMLQDIYAKHDFKPARMLLSLGQIPFQISYFFGIGKLMAASDLGLNTGGLLHFTDLTVSDPTYILPAASAMLIAFNVEMGGDGNAAAKDATRNMRMILRVMAPVTFIFTCQFPAGVVLYLVASNVFSTLQVLTLKIPGVKGLFGIRGLPTPPLESTPLELARQSLKATSASPEAVAAAAATTAAPVAAPHVSSSSSSSAAPPAPAAPAAPTVAGEEAPSSRERSKRARRRERLSS